VKKKKKKHKRNKTPGELTERAGEFEVEACRSKVRTVIAGNHLQESASNEHIKWRGGEENYREGRKGFRKRLIMMRRLLLETGKNTMRFNPYFAGNAKRQYVFPS